MRVQVKVNVNLNKKLIEELEGKAVTNALTKTALLVLGEIEKSKKVPRDSGDLERSGDVKLISYRVAQVVYDTPYARRWYFNTEGVEFNKNENPNAQDHWMDDFVHGDRREEIAEKFAEFYKEEIGGLLK